MYCKFCGNSLDDDSIFCSNCGKKILLNNIDNLNEGKVYKDINLQGSGNIEHKSIESESKKLIKRSQYFVPIPEAYEIKNSYQKESGATLIGFLILITSITLGVFKPFTFETEKAYNEYLTYASIFAIIIRVIAVFWVANTAKKQGRNELIWGLFAFFLPAIALIIIGLLNKIPEKIIVDNFLDDKENSDEFLRKGKELHQQKNYKDALTFAKKSLEINPSNEDAKDLLKAITLDIPVDKIANNEIQTVYRELKNGDILKITSKNYQTVGAKVFINEKVADDNIYEYKSGNREIIVKNGKIMQIKFI